MLAPTFSIAAATSSGDELICASTDGSPPAYLYQNSKQEAFTLSFSRRKEGGYSAARVDISKAMMDAVCKQGHGLALIPAQFSNETPKSAFGTVNLQKAVPTTWDLPSTFSIYKTYLPGFGYQLIGNFWIPKDMPSGHTNQWSAMDVITNNFSQTTDSAHFVHSLLTYSSDNITNVLSGQGIIFGRWGSTFGCGFRGLTYTTAVESWGNYNGQNGSSVHWKQNANDFPYASGGWPDTCGPQLTDGVAYGFVTGTAMSRWISYDAYYSGQGAPFYSSPSFQAGTANGSPPGFFDGYAGVTYFVAAGGDTTLWSLNFSGVGGGTY